MTQITSRRRVLQGLGMLGLGGVAHAACAQDCVNALSSAPALPSLPGTVGLLRGQFARLAVITYDHGNPGGHIATDLPMEQARRRQAPGAGCRTLCQ